MGEIINATGTEAVWVILTMIRWTKSDCPTAHLFDNRGLLKYDFSFPSI